jgi:tRNA A-37 threonylcarbamoyl transferase component Bud32
MDPRYEAYCLADPVYYERPELASSGGGDDPGYARLLELAPGWRTEPDGIWTHCHPSQLELPLQGWKIHVSATPDNAGELLLAVSSHCMRHGIPFKFLTNRFIVFSQSSKYAGRQSSGKFMTLYPRDVDQLHEALCALDRQVGGQPGPYILSDLRWHDGPLHVRYGGFRERQVRDQSGALVPAIEAPDGRLVPDRREPRFVVPDWVSMPSFLADAARARIAAVGPDDFPYDVLRPLHFSNGGGVYLARRRSDGIELILKEARPYAGLDMAGDAAVTRLRREYAVLADLHEISGVPRAHDRLTIGGHEFLVLDQLPGVPLSTWFARNYPLIAAEPDPAELTTYQAAVGRIVGQVRRIITEIHSHGYVYRDLHPRNILVDADLTVSLLDFELAVPVAEAGRRPLGAPGFAAPDSVRGFDADLYSLAALALHLYVPLSTLLWLCPEKVDVLLDYARSRFAVDESVADEIARRLGGAGGNPSRFGVPPADLSFAKVDGGSPATADGRWDHHISALVASIRRSASPERHDRLFPGDIDQFTHGAAGIAFGAAGVIATLHAAGCEDLDGYVDWLLHHVDQHGPIRPGLYDGLAGISHVLHEIGYDGTALRLFDRCGEQVRPDTGTKLFDGLSGIGLTSLSFYRQTGDPAYLNRAEQAAGTVAAAIDAGVFIADAASAGTRPRSNAVENFDAGLMHGWSGLALFMVRMFEVTEDERWLRAGVQALERDLDQCLEMADGSLQIENGERVLMYLATGSVGVALVGDLLLRHTTNQRLLNALPALCRPGVVDLCVGSGLLNGRAGLVYALTRLRPRLDWPDLDERLAAGIQRLDLHALTDGHGLVFPGDQNLRASMDVATGSAGVLGLLNVLSGRSAEPLPFLGEQRWHPPAAGSAGLSGREQTSS